MYAACEQECVMIGYPFVPQYCELSVRIVLPSYGKSEHL